MARKVKKDLELSEQNGEVFMDFITGFLLVLLLSTALFFGVKQVRAGEESWILNRPPKEVKGKDNMFLKREQLKDRLERLSKSKPPQNLSMGAMCYDMCMPTGTLDVICNRCKKKSVHPNCGTISDVIDSERLVQAIRKANEGLDATLDNRAFCASCSKGKKVTDKQLFLEVTYPGEDKKHRVAITRTELVALLALIQGKDRVEDEMGSETSPQRQGHFFVQNSGDQTRHQEEVGCCGSPINICSHSCSNLCTSHGND